MNNVVDKKIVLERTKFVLDTLAETVAVTYGVNGSNVMFGDAMLGGTNITKDGKKSLDHVRFQHELDTLIKRVVTEPAMKISVKSGDGTTSSILTIKEIFDAMMKENPSGIFDKTAKDIIEGVIIPAQKAFVNMHKKNVEETSDIIAVANISLAGELSLVKLIKEAYVDKDSTVFFNTGNYDHVKKTNGVKVPNMSGVYKSANDESGAFSQADARIINIATPIQTNDTISIVIKLLSQFATTNTPVVLIVDKMGDLASNVLTNYLSMVNKDKAIVNIIESSNILPLDKEYMQDLLSYLDVNSYSLPFTEETMGDKQKEEIVIDIMKNYTTNADVHLTKGEAVFNRDNTKNKSLEYKLGYLREELEKKDDEDIIDMNIKRRIANLQGVVSTIIVGGATQSIRATRLALIEDGVLAVRSAILNGVVGGMHMASISFLDHTLNELNEESIAFKLVSAIKDGYANVVKKYLLKNDSLIVKSIGSSGIYDIENCEDIITTYDIENNMVSKTILEPAESVIDIFNTTMSVIVALFRIDKVLLSIPEEALRYNRPEVK